MMGLRKPQPHANFEAASFSRYRNITGNPKILGAPLPQGHSRFFRCYVPKLCTKFDDASFSHCVNIEGEPPNLGCSPSPRHVHFSSGCDFMMGLGKPKLCTKFEVVSVSRCRNIKGEPQSLGSSLSPGPHSLFLLVRFDDGPWLTPAACQI